MIDLPKLDHLAPTINVEEIRQIGEGSLTTISEESTESTKAHGTSYTHTLIDPYGQEFLTFTPGFGGAVFTISNNEPLAMGRPIKRGSLRRKEMPTVGLRELT
jgi:hypothetical protein